MVVTLSAQERIVGVTVGDWFRYGDITVSWSSNDPSATFPPPGRPWLEEENETEWTLMSVQNISHTTIFFQTIKHFKNGTEKNELGFIDIVTGFGNISAYVHYVAISANLTVNDTVYTGPHFSSWKIDETIVRTYLDGERETNHLNMTRKWNITRYIDSLTVNGTGQAFINYYWDRSTGILVEHSYEEIEEVGEYLTTLSMSYRITESNVWVVPEFPTSALILLIFVVLIFATAIYKLKLLKTNPQTIIPLL